LTTGRESARVVTDKTSEHRVERLRLSRISKSFPGVRALHNVDFTAFAGEVHALLGENGAGKSTLMAVAAGAIAPDAGRIELHGHSVDRIQPLAAQAQGLAIVRQHPALLPDLTVAENLAVAAPPGVNTKGAAGRRWMRQRLERIGCLARLGDRVEVLPIAERQLIELAKALATEPEILILDEPTAPLGADMVERVFAEVREAAARGAAVIYISHRLPEVRQVADRVTVMRDGEVRESALIEEISDEEMVRLIVGRDLEFAFPPKTGESEGDPVLRVNGLDGPHFNNVGLELGRSEILGLAGIAGNGQSEVLRALAGLSKASGDVRLADASLKLGRSAAAREAGVAYLSSDRHGEGLVMPLSVRENASLSALTQYTRAGFVSRRREVAAVRRESEVLDVRTPTLNAEVSALSGGNQQRVALTRALLSNPRLVLVDEPTQGVDAGARVEIYKSLRQIAEDGTPVMVVSSDSLELEGLCDRVLVFSRGTVVRELTGPDVNEEEIARAMVTATTHREGTRSESDDPDDESWKERIVRFAKGDFAPSLVLLTLIIALAAYTYAQDTAVLSSFNIDSVLYLMSAVAFIGFGQLVVILTAGIDLSVGPLTGLLVVIASFFAVEGKSTITVAAGFLLMVAAAASVGLINGGLVRFAKFTPVAATLAMYIALQGVSLLLRETQGGFIDGGITAAIKLKVGGVPLCFLVAVALAVIFELGLRRTRWGLNLRAVGSDESAAHRLGIATTKTVLGAYVLCSCFTFLGAVMLMAQIGVGDSTQGVAYTLSSITAVVLGGASLFGGRGSFIGVLLGAALLQQTINATTFLDLGESWQYWIVGLLVVLAAGIYTKARHVATSP
jgi:ribose transport system ATP-binding protein